MFRFYPFVVQKIFIELCEWAKWVCERMWFGSFDRGSHFPNLYIWWVKDLPFLSAVGMPIQIVYVLRHWFFFPHSLNFSAWSFPPKFKFDGKSFANHVCDAAYGVRLHIAFELNLSVIYAALGVCAVCNQHFHGWAFQQLRFYAMGFKGFRWRKKTFSVSATNKQLPRASITFSEMKMLLVG